MNPCKRKPFPRRKATAACGLFALTLLGLGAVGALAGAKSEGFRQWMEPWPPCDSGRAAAVARAAEGFLFLVNASAGDTHAVHLVCADDSGQVRWMRAGGEGRNLMGRALSQLARGGCAICGSAAAHLGQPDFYLASLNAEGEIIWQREWGGEGSQGLNSLIEDSAGNLVIAGWAQNENREDADLYLAKTDARGNVIWTRQLGGPDEERLAAVCLAQSGSIIAAGQRAAADETMILLLKTDAQGQVLWQRTYKMEEEAHVADVCATSDGGTLVVSSIAAESYRPDECAAHALMVDAQGEPLWEQRYYLGPRCCDELRVQPEREGYMIAAFAIGCDTTRRGLQIVQLDRLGEALWRTFYSGNGFHHQGNKYGYWISLGADPLVQGLKVWFGESAGEFRLTVRNPRLLGKHRDKWVALVAFELPKQSPLRLQVCDIHGRQVETLLDVNCSPGRHSLWWDATEKPNGIYVMQLQTSEGTLSEKFVVMK